MAGRKRGYNKDGKPNKITLKRYEAFANEYVANGLNATQAYLKIYKNSKNEKSARVQSCNLLTNHNVQEFIQKAQAEAAKKTEITRDMLLAELAAIGFADLSTMVDENGQVKPFSEMGKSTKAISEIQTDSRSIDDQVIEKRSRIKAHDKLKAIQMLSNMLGFDTPQEMNVNHTGIQILLPKKDTE